MFPLLTIDHMLDHLVGNNYSNMLSLEVGYDQFYIKTIDTFIIYLKLNLLFFLNLHHIS